MTYLADVIALTRKDLRVELRGRDTLLAMLLFVLTTLVVFHFAIPDGAGDDAAYGLLWVAIVFTALLGLARAWVPEQEHGVLDALVLAPCDRSAIWLGKTLATLAFLLAAQVVALVNFGASAVNINILSGGQSLFTRDISIGGNAYTDALQRELNIPYETADALKRGLPVEGYSMEIARPTIRATWPRCSPRWRSPPPTRPSPIPPSRSAPSSPRRRRTA